MRPRAKEGATIRYMGRGDSGLGDAEFTARFEELPSVATITASWWNIWLSDEDGEVRLLSVEAPSQEAAESQAKEQAQPGETVDLVLPTADPEKLKAEIESSIEDARFWIVANAQLELDTMKEGGTYKDMQSLEEILPPSFSSFYTPEFIEEFLQTVEKTAEKIKAYPDTYFASTAEELAAHALLESAAAGLRELANDEELAADPLLLAAALENLTEIHETAFEDWDVLMLFEGQFDGLESSQIAESMGMANLHPRDWFKPFRRDQS